LTSVECWLSKWRKCRSCGNFGPILGQKTARRFQQLQD